ncbi:hypothetical protein BJV77DRAFT_1008474 [Russula vinacea]|nr:hypothetical protein BJV77DRAFT_1008474 [Russula vinacea]
MATLTTLTLPTGMCPAHQREVLTKEAPRLPVSHPIDVVCRSPTYLRGMTDRLHSFKDRWLVEEFLKIIGCRSGFHRVFLNTWA